MNEKLYYWRRLIDWLWMRSYVTEEDLDWLWMRSYITEEDLDWLWMRSYITEEDLDWLWMRSYITELIVDSSYFWNFLFSTSVESRTEKLLSIRPYVRPYDATNLGQFLSDHFHIAYGTFYCHYECLYRKKFLNQPSPSPSPFFGYFGVLFSETLGHRFQPIWDFPVWIFIFLASLGLSLGFFFFVWPNFYFWALQVLEKFWAQNLWREIRLSNGDQTFRIWSVST